MIRRADLRPVGPFEWEIPANYRDDMQVPVRLFASDALLAAILGDRSLEQAVNVATLPGLAGPVLVMPDAHQGYGFPIGGVAAFHYPEGVISPGGIGYDINCGVRLLASGLQAEEAAPWLADLANALYASVPSGTGKGGLVRLKPYELDQILAEGAAWAKRKGYATAQDVRRTEERGQLAGADPGKVSERAKKRGLSQLGSLGAGNHFLEVDVVESIDDARAADAMGLRSGQLVVQIHCGSRGLGHQVCTDYVQQFQGAVRRYGLKLPDRELVYAPLNSPEGKAYLAAMQAAANFAFVNRQVLAWGVRRAFERVFAGKLKGWHLHQVYDIAHNMGKIETHTISGQARRVCVHRKGATRAFGPGAPGLPQEYAHIGQPVIIPGSMGTGSWVLAGAEEGMLRTYGSTCHGAGRTMSRARARKQMPGEALRRALGEAGIHIRAGSLRGLAEEAPAAYKDVDEVTMTVTQAGIARRVARLRPLVVIKG